MTAAVAALRTSCAAPVPISLRPYQQRGVDAIRAAFRRVRRVLYSLPTGGGKTFTFAYIAQQAAAKGNPVLVLVHRKELLRQASVSLGAIGVRHGIVAPAGTCAAIVAAHIDAMGRSMVDHDAPVQVASVQTIGRRLKQWAGRFRLVIPDEAHHAVSGQFVDVLDSQPAAAVLGVTATPVRTDGTPLGDVFHELVEGPTIRELIELGNLVQPRVYAPPSNLDLTGIHRRGGDYVRGELAQRLAASSIVGDAVDHYQRLAAGQPAIAFCASVQAAEETARAFQARGIRAACVHGDMDDDERDRLILGHGKVVDVLTSCDLISEGTDTVAASCAILLRPTESEGLYLQQVGRVLRPAPGKSAAIILDHAGNCLRHGMPDADREWTLDGRRRGKGAANDNDPALAVRQCEKCYSAHAPMPRCPVCGFVYPVQSRKVEQVAGDLTEADPEEIERQRKARARRQEVGKARTRADLEAIAESRGYNMGWVRHMMRVKGIHA